MNEELQTASASERIREAYAQFLMSHPWDVFLTLTFDRRFANPQYGISPERADKDFRRLIRYVNEQLEGKRWMRKSSHKGVIWARAQEAQRQEQAKMQEAERLEQARQQAEIDRELAEKRAKAAQEMRKNREKVDREMEEGLTSRARAAAARKER